MAATARAVLREREKARRGGEYSFWGCAVQPQATPSETCLPHQLCITKAALDPVHAAKLPAGTRVSVWVTQKMRPQRGLHPVEAQKSLVAILSAAGRESAETCLTFRNSTLLSFSITPQSHACGVHLAGYFDHSKDAKPEEADDGSITWAELQALLANARGQSDDGGAGAGEGADLLEEMRRQIAKAQGRDADEGAGGGGAPEEKKQVVAAGGADDTGAGGRGRKRKAEGGEMNEKKQAALDKVRAAAAENEAQYFAEPSPASPISRHSKARTRKLAGGTQVVDLAPGSGAIIKVGSRVSLTVVEQDAKGKKKGAATKTSFIAGLKQVPSGLDRAVVGMRSGHSALVSLEAAGNDRQLGPWPQNQPLSLQICVDKVG